MGRVRAEIHPPHGEGRGGGAFIVDKCPFFRPERSLSYEVVTVITLPFGKAERQRERKRQTQRCHRRDGGRSSRRASAEDGGGPRRREENPGDGSSSGGWMTAAALGDDPVTGDDPASSWPDGWPGAIAGDRRRKDRTASRRGWEGSGPRLWMEGPAPRRHPVDGWPPPRFGMIQRRLTIRRRPAGIGWKPPQIILFFPAGWEKTGPLSMMKTPGAGPSSGEWMTAAAPPENRRRPRARPVGRPRSLSAGGGNVGVDSGVERCGFRRKQSPLRSERPPRRTNFLRGAALPRLDRCPCGRGGKTARAGRPRPAVLRLDRPARRTNNGRAAPPSSDSAAAAPVFGSTTKTARRAAGNRRPTSPRQSQRQPRPVRHPRRADPRAQRARGSSPISIGRANRAPSWRTAPPVRTGGPGLWAFGRGAREMGFSYLQALAPSVRRAQRGGRVHRCRNLKIGVRRWGLGRTCGTRASGPRLLTSLSSGDSGLLPGPGPPLAPAGQTRSCNAWPLGRRAFTSTMIPRR